MDKSEIIKMFDMMEKELNDENKMNIDAARARNHILHPEQRNGRIGIDLEEFPDNELLTLIFNKNIKTCNLYLDIIVNADDFRVMLCSGDDNLVDINVEQDVLIDILTKLLYYMPSIEIRGAFFGITDIPLSINYLEKYINNGIRYCNKAPFYNRLARLN